MQTLTVIQADEIMVLRKTHEFNDACLANINCVPIICIEDDTLFLDLVLIKTVSLREFMNSKRF